MQTRSKAPQSPGKVCGQTCPLFPSPSAKGGFSFSPIKPALRSAEVPRRQRTSRPIRTLSGAANSQDDRSPSSIPVPIVDAAQLIEIARCSATKKIRSLSYTAWTWPRRENRFRSRRASLLSFAHNMRVRPENASPRPIATPPLSPSGPRQRLESAEIFDLFGSNFSRPSESQTHSLLD